MVSLNSWFLCFYGNAPYMEMIDTLHGIPFQQLYTENLPLSESPHFHKYTGEILGTLKS